MPKKQKINDSRYPFWSAVVVNYYKDHTLLLKYYKTAQVAYLSLSYPLYTSFFYYFKKNKRTKNNWLSLSLSPSLSLHRLWRLTRDRWSWDLHHLLDIPLVLCACKQEKDVEYATCLRLASSPSFSRKKTPTQLPCFFIFLLWNWVLKEAEETRYVCQQLVKHVSNE